MERDLAYLPKQVSQQKEPLLKILQPYFRSHVSAVFDWKDPMPSLKRYIDFAKNVIGSVFGSVKAS